MHKNNTQYMRSHPLVVVKEKTTMTGIGSSRPLPLPPRHPRGHPLSAPWMAKTHVADREMFGRGTTPTQGGGPRTTPPPTGLSSRDQSLLKSRFSLSFIPLAMVFDLSVFVFIFRLSLSFISLSEIFASIILVEEGPHAITEGKRGQN